MSNLMRATKPVHEIQIYQYQVELMGGQRYGPSFNHEKEAEKYSNELDDPEVKYRARRIIRFRSWVHKSKFPALDERRPKKARRMMAQPELVK